MGVHQGIDNSMEALREAEIRVVSLIAAKPTRRAETRCLCDEEEEHVKGFTSETGDEI